MTSLLRGNVLKLDNPRTTCGVIAGGSGIVETSELAQELLNRLADPFFVQGHEVFMTSSIGVAYYPKDAPNVIDLIRNADAATSWLRGR